MRMQPSGRFGLVVALLALCGLSHPANAAVISINVSGLTNGASVGTYFNGGTDGYQTNGPMDGVTFSSPAKIENTSSGKFSGAPDGAIDVIYESYSSSAPYYMNVASGFSALSLDYALLNNNGANYSSTISVWSGANGTGSLLTTIALTPAASPVTCTTGIEFCNWVQATTQNFGTAQSITFSSPTTLEGVEFDNISITTTPLSDSFPLALGGLVSLLWLGSRKSLSRNSARAGT